MSTKFFLVLLFALAIWIGSDLLLSRNKDLRQFDPVAVGKLDAQMWKSYYERRKIRLFTQLSQLLQEQFDAPYWRSKLMAYRAAKAATTFQKGRNREAYNKALPHLKAYFRQINQLSQQNFDMDKVALSELEWWIIRREPQYRYKDWEKKLAKVSAEIYNLPARAFDQHVQLRVEAMRWRDEKGALINEEDWVHIAHLLVKSWTALHKVLNHPTTTYSHQSSEPSSPAIFH